MPGCHVDGVSEGAMLVNSINTELLCGEPKRRPVKILFHPSSGQDSLDNCGDQVQLSRRNSRTAFGFEFVKTGGDKKRKVVPHDFHLNTLSGNTSNREPIVIKPNRSTVLSFYIDERDVGGTLAVELAIYNTKVLAAKLAIVYIQKL